MFILLSFSFFIISIFLLYVWRKNYEDNKPIWNAYSQYKIQCKKDGVKPKAKFWFVYEQKQKEIQAEEEIKNLLK